MSNYRDEMIYDWYIKYPLANGMIPIEIVKGCIIRMEDEWSSKVGEEILDHIRRLPKTTQELRVELNKLQVEIRENAIASGADMGQVREMFMLQWEEFAGYRI